MLGIGLTAEPSLEDLFTLNQSFFDWPASDEPTETELFGAPALAIKTKEGDSWTNILIGFVDDQAFMLSLSAPTEEALDSFMPTWERMLESIEIIP